MGTVRLDLVQGGDDAPRDLVAARDAAKDVEQHRLDVGVGQDEAQGRRHPLGLAPPPMSRKLAGTPPKSLIMSIVAMARPAPLTMQPISPPKLDVAQAGLARLALRLTVSSSARSRIVGQVGVAEEGVVVDAPSCRPGPAARPRR